MASVFFTGCKKDNENPAPKTQTPKQNDQAASAEKDEALNDVNDIINNKIGGGSNMRVSAYNLPCGVVSVDSSTTAGGYKVYKLNYGNQTPCGYKYKSGQISFSLQNATSFGATGAVFAVTFTDYTVEVKANGSIIKLNGSIYVTNVTGGYTWQAVTNSQTITHRIRGTLNITYANNEVRQRKFYELRTYDNTSTPSDWAGLRLTIAGDTTINATQVSETGKTLEGNYDFKTEVLNDFVWSNCGTSWTGPYLLKNGNARLNVTIPLISPTYIQVEAGYHWEYSTSGATPTLVNDCSSNAYKITTVIGTSTNITYQLY